MFRLHWALLWEIKTTLRFKSGAFPCLALSVNAPLARAADQSEPSEAPGGRPELINMQVSGQWEGVFTLPPRREVRSCTGRETAARRSEPRSSQAGSPSPTASIDWTRRLLHSLRWKYCRISLKPHGSFHILILNGRRTRPRSFPPCVLWFYNLLLCKDLTYQ